MAQTITICDELIDKVIPPHIDRALSTLGRSAQMCGRSVCGGGTRPRLVFRTQEERTDFMTAARAVTQTSELGQWLQQTNPRLAVQVRGHATTIVPSIDFV